MKDFGDFGLGVLVTLAVIGLMVGVFALGFRCGIEAERNIQQIKAEE